MPFQLHTIEMPDGAGPQKGDRINMSLAQITVPAAGAACTALGSITAGTGYDILPLIAPSGGTLTAGVTPAVPAVVRATSLKLVSASPATAGTGVAINDTFSLAGGILAASGPGGNTLGTAGVASVVTATHIKAVSAVVNAGGTSGTPGAVTITGTTGTGTKFQATGTINGGGALVGPLVVTVAGDYTVGVTSLAAEPITGGSLSGATVTLVMGALTFSLTTVGGYTTAPAAPNTATNGTGSGAGVTVTCAFGLGTAVIEESGNYSGAPSFTVTANDANGSGASIATATLGGAGSAVFRQVSVKGVPNMGGANIQSTSTVALDAVMEIQSLQSGPGPDNLSPYLSISVQPRLAANTLAAGTAHILILS
jgi:hypothetical protein